MNIYIIVSLVFVGAHGAVFPEKRATSHCNSFCPMFVVEFCGSDGKTYNSNECFEKSRLCNEGANDYDSFTTLHMGACTGNESSLGRRQVCSSFCPMYIIEFCGSDGKTYHSNECFERSKLCHQGANDYESFKSLHYGACTGNELTATTTTVMETTIAV